MYAITPRGVGEIPGARRVANGSDLAEGEAFFVEDGAFSSDYVLADDEVSLRPRYASELDAEQRSRFVALVKLEAQRRINLLFGSTDLNASLVRQSNAQMRAIELTNIKHERAHTPEEAAEVAALQAIADSVRLIRTRSNEIEAMDPMPSDYASNDSYWT